MSTVAAARTRPSCSTESTSGLRLSASAPSADVRIAKPETACEYTKRTVPPTSRARLDARDAHDLSRHTVVERHDVLTDDGIGSGLH